MSESCSSNQYQRFHVKWRWDGYITCFWFVGDKTKTIIITTTTNMCPSGVTLFPKIFWNAQQLSTVLTQSTLVIIFSNWHNISVKVNYLNTISSESITYLTVLHNPLVTALIIRQLTHLCICILVSLNFSLWHPIGWPPLFDVSNYKRLVPIKETGRRGQTKKPRALKDTHC